MGQHYPLQAIVFRVTVLLVVLVSIRHGHCTDCSLCQYKTSTTTSEINVFVGNASFCNVQNASFINSSQNNITVTGLLPGNTYFLIINCTSVCCGNFSTNSTSNLIFTQLNSTSVYVNWTDQLISTNQSFTLRPEPVFNLSVNSITVSSMILAWTPPYGSSPYYKVAWVGNLALTNQISMQISSLSPGTKYNFNVTSVATDNSTEGRATTISQNTSPAQVQNITVVNYTNSSATVVWVVPDGHVDSYTVNCSTQSIPNINNSSITISNLLPGRLFNLTVTSISGVLTNVSNIVQFATKPNPPEAAGVSGQTFSSISLLWSTPLNMSGMAVSYGVSYVTVQPGVNLSLTTSSYMTNITNLLSGTQYNITVVTIGVNNLTSSFVNLIGYTVPNSVQNLAVSNVSTNSVSLTWLPPNGMSSLFSYNINIPSLGQTFNTTSNSYQITQLQPGTQYNCIVTTLIVAGNISGPSQLIQCNTKPLPVSNLTVTPVGTTVILLSWTPSTALYLYNVSVNGTWSTYNSNGGANVTGLTPGNSYIFTVITVANGLSSEPVTISAFTGLGKATIISAIGNTQSMIVQWTPPAGTVSLYSVRILLMDGTVLNTKNQTNTTSMMFSDLLPGTQYSVIVSSISGPIKQDSDSVTNATLPTPPGEISTTQSTNTLNISWAQPLNMSSVSYYFLLQYNNSTLINCSQNYTSLTGLNAGVPYNITVWTVGAMNYSSSSKSLTAYTNPTVVTNVKVNGYTETSITLSWQQNDPQQSGYSYLLNYKTINGTPGQTTANNTMVKLEQLQSASQYNISIIALTPGGTKSDPQLITACSRPYCVNNVSSVALNVSTVRLSWARPLQYNQEFTYQVLVSNCTKNSVNLSTSTEIITVTNLQPGTLCQISIYSVACGLLGQPVNTSVLTMPSTVQPVVNSQGSNNSLLVSWGHPDGGLDMYILNMSSDGWSDFRFLNSTENNYTFTQLKAATLYTVTLTTVKGSFQETSRAVVSATYPNSPGKITVLFKNTHSVFLQWDIAQNMTPGSFNYSLSFWSSNNRSLYLTPNNTLLLDGLQSGMPYNVSLSTVGPLNLQSASMRYNVTTKPDPVKKLTVYSTTTDTISISWEVVDVPKYVVSVSNTVKITSSNNMTIHNLQPSTRYNISVQSSTFDNTEGEAVCLQECTDAAPVENVTCVGPNLTLPMLNLSWNYSYVGYLGFEVNLSPSFSGKTTNLTYNFTGLKYNKEYSVTLRTLGCGKNSIVKNISCKTGFTNPVVPKITAASVSEQQYNKFALVIQSDAFNDSDGTVCHYGLLVSSGSFDCLANNKYDQCLLKTYDDWKAKQSDTFLAVVKPIGSRSKLETITIGDGTKWNGYKNGELNAKDTYNFAIVAFTLLEVNGDKVDVSKSYYSVSVYQSVTLPENPVVIGGAAAGVGVTVIIVVIIIGIVTCTRKKRKEVSNSVPIHSLRNKVSDPIKVEDYEAYYRRQRADSFCGFAEEFEDLRPVGINQSKTVALAPENKAKNRYNNVLPYDSSRVKLSVLSSPFDDYINANYMPGYNTKKEFIAAQGPLPGTVNDFWRLIWEKNVHTIVMLTKCNEQGRVKCEEYWPAEMKSFSNLTVTTISEIPLEDWTLRDFEVKNMKTAEMRSVRHFHFTAWPDHGVPETTELLINFRHLVREHMDEYSRHSPTLVHCSAGVGRTGTFIAIDRLIFQIERDGVVDVYGIIHDLRMHRTLMVQTEDQYVFLNQCAMDIIKSRTGNNVDLIYQNTAALTIYENFEPLKKGKNGYHKA
ncbi:receptor-type tyrosine-protein phosphatase eta [Danio aesculapii]|uniref:receptor-type tyrosine-protein phosphatase eta n=1 Tax=Danio aesculapii TaxID=1142201 RepID=UPI0024C00582|nr:receptor-type tyrosine-protein phosphatase eta [Danio aesculapii]